MSPKFMRQSIECEGVFKEDLNQIDAISSLALFQENQSASINILLFRAFMCFNHGVLDGIASVVVQRQRRQDNAAGGQTDWKTGQYSGWASGPLSVVAVQCVSCQQATQHSTPVHKCMYHINITPNQLSTGLCCVTDPSFIVPVVGDYQIPKIPKGSFLWETREC